VHSTQAGHSAYIPDLASSNFQLFPSLTEVLGGRCFKSNEEVKDALQQWLNGLAAKVNDIGIQNSPHAMTNI